jgi:hypothetical protein
VDTAVDIGTEAGDGRWMNYAELAAARGIDRTSALKLALRHKWRKQSDNRGTVRVYVPLEWADPQDKRAAPGADVSTVIGTLEAAIAALRQPFDHALAALRGRSEADQATIAELQDQITTLQGDLTAARQEAEQGRRDLEAAQMAQSEAETRAKDARDAAEALRQAEAERRALGRWARLKAAWRGE